MRRDALRAIGWAALAVCLVPSPTRLLAALPTPTLSEEEMLKEADLVVEGRVVGVVLAKRWVGDTVAVDQGYERGNFRSWVLVTKVVKGPSEVDDTVEVFTQAYKEGAWSQKRDFVYQGTEDAITPGNRVRFYLKWDPKLRRYERVHFNSGYVLLERSKGQHPTNVGQPAIWDAGGRGKSPSAARRKSEPGTAPDAASKPAAAGGLGRSRAYPGLINRSVHRNLIGVVASIAHGNSSRACRRRP